MNQATNKMTLKERISKLTAEDKEKLGQYVDAVKEIKKEIKELLNKQPVQETGGNRSSGLSLKVDEKLK